MQWLASLPTSCLRKSNRISKEIVKQQWNSHQDDSRGHVNLRPRCGIPGFQEVHNVMQESAMRFTFPPAYFTFFRSASLTDDAS